MADQTIHHDSTPSTDNGSLIVAIVAIAMIVGLAILFLTYAVPMMNHQPAAAPQAPGADIEVRLPEMPSNGGGNGGNGEAPKEPTNP